MIKGKRLFIILLVFTLLSSTVVGLESTCYKYNLSYRFENRGNTSIDLTLDDVTIPLFMNTSKQTVRLENVSQEYVVKVIDVDGNTGAIIGIDRNLSPGDEVSFSANYKISSSGENVPSLSLEDAEGFEKIPLEFIEEYTISTETFPGDNPLFTNLTHSLVSEDDSVLEAVSVLAQYIMDNTTYCNFEVPKYPIDTLENHQGDCDDQSILLITLCRSLNIPAYLQVGIYIHPSVDEHDSSWEGHLTNIADGVGWHGWAMIYIPPWGWVPVDMTLTNSDSGLDLIKKAPEYDPNIISVLNVSRQSYIAETLKTRERLLNSSLYVTVVDEARTVYSPRNPSQNYLLMGLFFALLASIGLMYKYGEK